MPSSRRQTPRVQAANEFLVEFERGGKKLLHKGFGFDLTESGASFATLAPLTRGSVVDLLISFSLQFPGTKTVRVRGEIVHVNRPGGGFYPRMGCRFKVQDGEVRDSIHEFIAWVAKGGKLKKAPVKPQPFFIEGRRGTKRVQAPEEFFVEFSEKRKPRKIERGYGYDLSTTGLFFASLAPLQKGSELEMVVYFSPDFPGVHQIKLSGCVVRSHLPPWTFYHRIGCHFDSLDTPARQVIDHFLSWIESRRA